MNKNMKNALFLLCAGFILSANTVAAKNLAPCQEVEGVAERLASLIPAVEKKWKTCEETNNNYVPCDNALQQNEKFMEQFSSFLNYFNEQIGMDKTYAELYKIYEGLEKLEKNVMGQWSDEYEFRMEHASEETTTENHHIKVIDNPSELLQNLTTELKNAVCYQTNF